MKLYHLIVNHCGHEDFFEFTVYAKSHQQAFNLAKTYAKQWEDDYDFDDDISHWRIEVVKLDHPQVIQDSILYG
ncbi:hypothetical protein LMB63_09940 [Limosilactobacillus reuteri]|uniref:hypothetical protein n=1 Tax=Limosilactobacillus reuteri TaxID=1598 RepID=UPI0015F7BF4A|nr:hypothetical protein [Limosilactobacillus reuteri]MBB1072354.1 hypothetical protein [Limosilactobacillus reuteri]MCC4511597.1 hypothetical protein [Limosilactobacillus reuteri]MCC4513460.1 hypothetical protein [Limosilactobacillus reuteri]